MNCVTLVGKAVSDVELSEVDGRKRAVFLLGIDRDGRADEPAADFVNIVTWDRQAEVVANYVGLYSRVAVDGRLRSRSCFEDGARRSVIEVHASRVQFLRGLKEATRS